MSRPFSDLVTDAPQGRMTSGAPSISTPHWQGPLALLVELAQRRRFDLKTVSMVDLVDACLAALGSLDRVEEKADQLLLAADLALMKSRLLLGAEDARADEEDALRQQALRLQRIQRVAEMLMGRDQLGRELWPRGAPELEADRAEAAVVADEDLSLIDIIRAYAHLRLRDEADAPIEIRRILAMTLSEALQSLGARVDELEGWTELFAWAGQGARQPGVSARSQAAASFVAMLEMARQGQVEIRQDGAFGEVRVGKV